MKIGICIPVVNLWARFTKPCIDSLKSKHQMRIVVVDNGSSDETQMNCKQMMRNIGGFYYIRNEKNIGCAAGWNQGVKNSFETGCDYVLVINNDVLLHPEAIDNLVDRMLKKEDGDRRLAMATCMNIRGDCPTPESIFTKDLESYRKVVEAEHPDFSGFMINRDCWNTVGYFDEEYFPGYFEDNSYHYRINHSGMKAITNPSSLFYHYGSMTSNGNRISEVVRNNNFERNRSEYIKMWGGQPGQEKFQHPYDDKTKSCRKSVDGKTFGKMG
ncbi:MAG: glycosyltransferase family 2 protein [Nitrospiria bacterium]